jgi:hypothetical protein
VESCAFGCEKFAGIGILFSGQQKALSAQKRDECLSSQELEGFVNEEPALSLL